MEKIYIECQQCAYTRRITTLFLFKYLRNELLELFLRSFPGSTIQLVVVILFPNSKLSRDFLKIINQRYYCPKCGHKKWMPLSLDNP